MKKNTGFVAFDEVTVSNYQLRFLVLRGFFETEKQVWIVLAFDWFGDVHFFTRKHYKRVRNRHPSNTGCSQPDVASQTNERLREDIYGRAPSGRTCLQRQHSNPQLPSRTQADEDFKRLSQPSVATTEPRCADVVARKEEQTARQQNPVSSMRLRGIQGPPKPPRIITTLRKAALSDSECNSQTEQPPAKPPR